MAYTRRHFIYHADRLPSTVYDARVGEVHRIVEMSRRRWAVRVDDNVILVSGVGRSLQFIGAATVTAVKVTSPELNGLVGIDATIEVTERFPADRTLENFAFSLVKVANVRRPWVHFRHRARLSDIDFGTLKKGRIAWDRTVFLGLLSALPDAWRNALVREAQAKAGTVASRYAVKAHDVRGADLAPASALLSLIETTVMVPMRLGADLDLLLDAVLGRAQRAAVETVTPDGTPEPWSLIGFLTEATRSIVQSETDFSIIRSLPVAQTIDTESVPWPVPRW